jgi:cobalt-zinc-cadmium efflux system outer membrane protein
VRKWRSSIPRFAILLAITAAGCHASPDVGSVHIERLAQILAPDSPVPSPAPGPTFLPCGGSVIPVGCHGPLNLRAFLDLALANNPSLREAAADVDVARGHLAQAGLYPNPRFLYEENTIGSQAAPEGNIVLQVNQEIVTAGKRHLDMAVASRETDAAALALLGRKFEVLTRVRRAYYDYAGWAVTVTTNEEIVAVLGQGLKVTRQLVEEAKTRPQTDLLRIEALLEEAKINLERSRVSRDGAWRQLAAEVGVPQLPMTDGHGDLPDKAPCWEVKGVEQRVFAVNTALKEAGVEVERARLALARARAQAVPNVTVGAGYSAENVDHTTGGLVSVETPLPLWDRNQGNIHAAEAQFIRAQAAVNTTANRLSKEIASAYTSYEAARQQVERLTTGVLPRLDESLKQLRKGYQAGAPQVTFADVLQAEQSLLTARLTLAEARRELWLAVADLQGLMQVDVGEEFCKSAAYYAGMEEAH